MKNGILLLALCGAPAAAQWTVVILDPGLVLAPHGSSAEGVWGDRQVGWIETSGTRAVVWSGTAASMVEIHPAHASASRADAVWNDVTVGSTYFPASHAAMWSGPGNIFTDLHPAGATFSAARAVSGAKQTGARAATGAPTTASQWAGDAASFVNLWPTTESHAYGIAGDQAAGFYTEGGFTRAALWNGAPASVVPLHPPGVTQSLVNGTTGSDHVGLVEIGGEPRAARWSGTSTAYVNLHPAGATSSEGKAISGNVQVGWTRRPLTGNYTFAAYWNGTAASYVDLHALLPAGMFVQSRAQGVYVDQAGRVTVVGWGQADPDKLAVMWVRAAACYANCDNSTLLPLLNIQDFTCFLNRFANGESYANCDGSTIAPTLNVQDFTCFLNRFAAGCS